MKRLLAIVVLLAACGAPSGDIAAPATGATGTPPAAGTAAPTQVAAAGVPEALDWSAERLGGGQIEGGDLAGRDVVLWFWAPW